MHTDTIVRCASAALLAASLSAQGFNLYVDPAGTPTGQGLTPSTAFSDLAAAVASAQSQLAAVGPNRAVTINVAPGTYTVATPLSIPAYGIHIEGYAGGAKPVLNARFTVDSVGDSTDSPTQFSNLRFETPSGSGASVVRIAPGARTSTAVTIIGCEFVQTSVGSNTEMLTIEVGAGAYAEHRLISCRFDSPMPTNDIGAIGEYNAGISNTLYLANHVRNFRTGIIVDNTLTAPYVLSACRPRMFSNGFELGERLVEFAYCTPRFVNNSIGEFKDHDPTLLAEAFGVQFEECTDIVSVNNASFFEPTGAFDSGDFSIIGGTVQALQNNYSSDTPGATDPFVPGDFPRLSPASGLAEAGTIAFAQPGTIAPNGNGGTVPADVPVDFEGDMRIVQSAVPGAGLVVAIGCDQIAAQRAAVLPSAAIDAFGTLYLDMTGSTQPFTLRTTGLQSGWIYTVALSGGYDGITQHLLDPSYGSFTTLPFAPNLVWTSPAAVAGASGIVDITVPGFSPGPQVLANLIEAQFYLQGVALSPNGAAGLITNRVRIELDFDPSL